MTPSARKSVSESNPRRGSGNSISRARVLAFRMPTHVETLEIGLKVVLRPIPETKALSTWVVYRIGSRNEVPGMTGSTHWVEHMLFKGGGKLGKGDIDKFISRLGGKMNAFTDTDYTMYFETIPASAMDTALMIESERMRNAAFDPKEVEAERTVVISEREGAENQPEFLVDEELWGLAFHVHPYHWTPIGYKQDLASLDREPLYHHYLRYYAPNNASLILVGGSYRALVESKLATDVGVRQEMKLDPSLLIASATCAKGAPLDRVEHVIDREVDKLRRTPPNRTEVERAKQQVRSWARYEQDGVTFQGMLLSAGEGLSSWDFGDRLLGKVADRVEGIGATVEFHTGEELLGFNGRCTRDSLRETIRILVECLSEPTFPQREIDRVRGELLNDLRIEADDTHSRAARELARFVFPNDHPYGRDPKGGADRVRRIRRRDLVEFHESHIGPEGLILAVTGEIDRELVEEAIAAPLSRLDTDQEGIPAIPPPPPHKPRRATIPMPHKTQADIAIGGPAVPPRHPGYYALDLANLLFGRIGFYGRLRRDFRDEQRLAYYAVTGLDARTAGGGWCISAGGERPKPRKRV